jgi:hypothetical protein
MIEAGEHLRFAFEAREPIAIRGEVLGQHLDRHLAVQLRIACAVHLTHAARSERRDDLVRADASPGS